MRLVYLCPLVRKGETEHTSRITMTFARGGREKPHNGRRPADGRRKEEVGGRPLIIWAIFLSPVEFVVIHRRARRLPGRGFFKHFFLCLNALELDSTSSSFNVFSHLK